jgi:hypothetical protein
MRIAEYSYQQALQAVQVNFETTASYEDFVKTKPSKSTIMRMLGLKQIISIGLKFPANQRQKRKAWANNPRIRPKK